MAIKVQGSTIIDDSRNVINATKVGIGTTNPTVALDVRGTVGIGTIIDIIPYDTINNGTLSWEGSAGQLFSITNNLTSGSIFSVNDVSGIPSIDVDADGTIQLAPYGSTEYIGIGTTNPTAKLDVYGDTNISGSLSVGSSITFGTSAYFGDNDVLNFGDDNDLQIYYDGTNSYIKENASSGSLIVNGNWIVFKTADDTETYARFITNAQAELYYDNAKKFETTGYGVTVSGGAYVSGITTFQNNVFFGDNDILNIGDSNDLQIYHNSSDGSVIRKDFNGDGNLEIRSNTFLLRKDSNSERHLYAISNAQVELYYDGSKKFETTADGILVRSNVGLGTVAGNSQDLATFQSTNANTSLLRIVEERDVNGTDWNSAYTRIQKTIDVTDQAYIQFNGNGNSYGMEFGTQGDEKFAQFIRNGAVELYYDNSKKFETTSYGIYVTGAGNTSTIGGAANLVLDPSTVGDNTGTVTILGNLQVDGTQTVINSTTMTVDDLNITLASGAANASAANGAGITIDGASATLTYASSGDQWVFNKAPYYNTDRLLTTADEGSGNGIDADTVDGIEASSFVRSDAADTVSGNLNFTSTTTPITTNSIKFNNSEMSSSYYTDATGVLAFDENFYSDTAYGTGTYDPNNVFTGNNGGGILIKNEDGWGAVFTSQNTRWATAEWDGLTVGGNNVLTTADEGSGNGIDADTVDGLEASQFLRSDANDTASGIVTFSNGDSNFGTGTATSAEFGVNTVGAGAIKLHGTTSNAYGLIQATTSNLHIDTVVGGTYLNYYDGDFISFGTGGVGEGGRFYGSTKTLVIGTTSETGTSSQRLQVTGGAYVSGNLGVGKTNPSYKLDVSGDILFNNNAIISADDGTNNIDHFHHNDAAAYGQGGTWHFVSDSTYKGTGNSAIRAGAFVNMADTGTASQKLQITGGAYVSGNLGIGDTNPGTKLKVYGNTWIDNASGDTQSRAQAFTVSNAPASNWTPGTDPGDSKRNTTFATKGSGRPVVVTWRNIDDAGGAFWDFVADASTDKFYIQRGGAYQPTFTWDTNQQVAIGTDVQSGSTLAVGGTITELYNGSYWNVVTQADVGYGASQVPLNQYLGQLAFLDDYHPNGLRRDGGGSDDVFVNSSGKVGFGTTNPIHNIDVYKTSNDAIIRTKTTAAGAYFDADSNTEYYGVRLIQAGTVNWFVGSYGSSNLQIKDGAQNNGTEVVTIENASGNVGIGTNDPGYKLDVRSTTNQAATFWSVPSSSPANIDASQFFAFNRTGAVNGLTYSSSDQRLLAATITPDNEVAWRANKLSLASTDYISLRPGGAVERFRVTSAGDVGIGLTNPSAKLEIYSNADDTKLLRFNMDRVWSFIQEGTAAGTKLELNSETNGKEFRITGEDRNPFLTVATYNSANLSSGRVYLCPEGGLVGIGTDIVSGHALEVIGSVRINNGTGTALDVSNGGIVGVNALAFNDPGPNEGITWSGGNGWSIYESPNDLTTNSAGNLQFVDSGSRVFTLDTSGNGEFTGHVKIDSGPTLEHGGSTELQVTTNHGYVRIGPKNTSYSHFETDRTRFYFNKRIVVDEGIISSYNEDLVFQTDQQAGATERVRIQTSNGYVGINTTTPQYQLEVNGSFAATTKSFVIDHPTKDGMKLRYGSLEGPENGVYVRGRLKGNNTIELPEHWTGLVDEETITVNLTPIGRKAPLHSVVDIADNTVVVESANDVVDCFYTVFGERKDVEKLEVEF